MTDSIFSTKRKRPQPPWSLENPAPLWELFTEEDIRLISQGYLPEKDIQMLEEMGITGFDKDGNEVLPSDCRPPRLSHAARAFWKAGGRS